MSATKGRIYKLKNKCYIVNHLATLELKEDVHPDFIVYSLRAFSPVKLINDPAYPSISQSAIEKHAIPLPPLEDQIRIANLLSRIEGLIAKRKESIRLLDEFVKSTFLEMFGDPVRNEKGWERKTIGDLTSRIVVGHVGPTSEGYALSGIPFIRTQNVRENFINFNDIKYITKEFHVKLKKSQIYANDILISRVGVNRGMAAVVPERLNGANCANVVVIGNSYNFNSVFISYYLNLTFGAKPEFGFSVGSAQGVVNTSIVKKWPIILAPIILQNKFANVVVKVESMKLRCQFSLFELEKLYGSVSQRAFRGEM